MKPRVQQTTDGGETAPVASKETLPMASKETAPVASKETLPMASKVNCYWPTRTMQQTLDPIVIGQQEQYN